MRNHKLILPIFLNINQIISKKKAKNYIEDLNKSKEDEYKIKLGNIQFFNKIKKEKEKEEFQIDILTIYNCISYLYSVNKVVSLNFILLIKLVILVFFCFCPN